MILQFAMDMAGTFPILGYLLIKKIFRKHVSAKKYIQMLRISILLYLCPFQELKYLILPEKVLERFNLNDFWGIAGKKIGGFKVVNIPSLSGNYYVVPERIFELTIVWLIIGIILIAYHYGAYFVIKRQIKKNGIKTEMVSGKRGASVEVFQSTKVKTPCTVGWLCPKIFIPERKYSEKEKEWLLHHELTHIRHRDVFWKFLSLISCTLHWYNPFVYYVFQQYSVMCEYYCDAECMQDRNIEEKKKYAIFLVRSAADMPKHRVAIVQGLTNNGEKMQERIDRILDRYDRPAKVVRMLATGIFIIMCMCSFMSIFVYSATQEQDVPGEDNSFTEEEWNYFYEEDGSTGEETLDFSKSACLFQPEQGEIIPISQADIESVSSDKQNNKPKKKEQAECSHVIEKGLLKVHQADAKNGCHIKTYDAKRCSKCGLLIKKELSYASDYASCPHNLK